MYTLTKEEWLSQYEGKVSERDLALMSRAHEVLAENTLDRKICPGVTSPPSLRGSAAPDCGTGTPYSMA